MTDSMRDADYWNEKRKAENIEELGRRNGKGIEYVEALRDFRMVLVGY